jgi:hypothetical protein
VTVRVYPEMARVVQPRVEDDDDNNDDDSGKSKGMGTIRFQRVQNPRAHRAKEKALKFQIQGQKKLLEGFKIKAQGQG